MTYYIYKVLTSVTRIAGTWFFRLISWWVATGYFFLFPKRLAIGVRFYSALFPERGKFYHFWCTWRQYHNFTSVYLDGFLLRFPEKISYSSDGMEHLYSAAGRKEGGMILMSHMGNWELAARLLQGKGIRLLLYVGIKLKEKLEQMQKNLLAESGISIIAVDQGVASPFELIDGITFIREGGFVSITGDRIWHNDQRTVDVSFLGHRARLPETPYQLALLSKAPVFIFFIFKSGKYSYHITCSEPMYVSAPTRADRKEAIQTAAETYAQHMEEALRAHPFEWYTFEQFLEG